MTPESIAITHHGFRGDGAAPSCGAICCPTNPLLRQRDEEQRHWNFGLWVRLLATNRCLQSDNLGLSRNTR